uniref:Uncharacterized protein n=1 Tax=Arundo donax TaxID=35708 RepID=A0A0A9EBG8_ARUDO
MCRKNLPFSKTASPKGALLCGRAKLRSTTIGKHLLLMISAMNTSNL